MRRKKGGPHCQKPLGFIGLGVMGSPMARNLLMAGFPLIVQNHRQTVTDEFVALGARSADHPREVAEQCDAVILMLPDSPQVEAVIHGPTGILAGARQGSS